MSATGKLLSDANHHETTAARAARSGVRRNGQTASTQRRRQTENALAQPKSTAAAGDCAAVDEWLPRISRDRPVYGCPKCSEPAMQFYAAHPLFSERTEFFHCHACGIDWEI